MPSDWNECRLVLLHKGKHKSKNELKNYRSILLGNTEGKIFNDVLSKRLCRWTEETKVLSEEQTGFHTHESVEDNIFVLYELNGRKKKEGRKLYLDFLDIEKAE